MHPMIDPCGYEDLVQQWAKNMAGNEPAFACVFGFTETCLIPGISRAGKTPADRRYTALADAEFLVSGVQQRYRYPLPPLVAGASPAFVTRAVTDALDLPVWIFNAGLPEGPTFPVIDLGGSAARCLSSGNALDLTVARQLFDNGLKWGARLAETSSCVIIGECVVGGTTTALAILTALGIPAESMVSSSNPQCNHVQKEAIVKAGLKRACLSADDPVLTAARVGDPVQLAIAGMAMAASRSAGVLLAGGTQMIAIYALSCAIAGQNGVFWTPENILIGTTRWVIEDPTSDATGLVKNVASWASSFDQRGPSIIATKLCFSESRHEQLRAYECGFVKEGVGAGGAAIASHLYANWDQRTLLAAIDDLVEKYAQATN